MLMQRIKIPVFNKISAKENEETKISFAFVYFAIQVIQWYSLLHIVAQCKNKMVLTESWMLIVIAVVKKY
jgi:hypothetical protein